MKEITFEESKKVMLDALINVARFCDQQGINYSLAYGTLIGAIRHKGFIPWDDDIDIIMLRDDYERFIASYKDDRYEIVDGSHNPNHSHIRVSDQKTVLKLDAWRGEYYKEGLWIDVFPIDKVPDTKKGYLRFKKWIWFLFAMQLNGELHREGLSNKIKHFICRPSRAYFGKRALREMKRYNDKKTQTVANLGLWYLSGFPEFPASYMEEFVDVEFESNKFKAIKQYDAFLRKIYGDYMQFPPEKEQIPHHTYIAYWRDLEQDE